APGLRAFADKRGCADQRSIKLGNEKRLAGSQVVRGNVVDVWIAGFVDEAEMLAQAQQDQAARGGLVGGGERANQRSAILHGVSISRSAAQGKAEGTRRGPQQPVRWLL